MAFSCCNKNDLFRELLVIDQLCLEWLGNSPLRPDAKLFLLIAARGSLTIKEAMHSSALSNRAFYQMVDRLKKENKVMVVPDNTDRRVHRLVLDQTLMGVPSAVTRMLDSVTCRGSLCQLKAEKRYAPSAIPAAIVDMGQPST